MPRVSKYNAARRREYEEDLKFLEGFKSLVRQVGFKKAYIEWPLAKQRYFKKLASAALHKEAVEAAEAEKQRSRGGEAP